MTDLGLTMREVREEAGYSLSGMAKRTGYSRGYLGNVETGERQVTPDVIRAYERVLGDRLKRRQLLIAGGLAAFSAGSTRDAAVSIASEIGKTRNGLLLETQTSHATDRAIASIVARDTPSLAALVKWSRAGTAVLRVNAAGILAKVGSPLVDSEAIAALRTNATVRELYLTAVLSRVLALPWGEANNLASSQSGLANPEHVVAMSTELNNPYDSVARWCSTVMLYRTRTDDPVTVSAALIESLKTEPARENLRAIGSALAGVDPLTI
ncbi:helix-turn-helix domain-containing protein [Krasilnikovia sp. M28-CT-15]|uniref:helix-turn-helix domain-containing protein n=1 Tax=Krasilnikovia sp. M28-CT-15 TaxID=3373540 RepID=UPI003876877A